MSMVEDEPTPIDRASLIEQCRRICRCSEYTDHEDHQRKSRSEKPKDNDDYDDEQRTFISFITELISVMAFIFFGSVVFWLAIGGILFDFFKKLYYSHRYVKLVVIGIFALLLLSMMLRQRLNRRALRDRIRREEKEAANPKPKSNSNGAPKPPPEYMKVQLRDKKLRDAKNSGDGKSITKKFTLSIVDEKKKEVFRTSQTFSIPDVAMDMKKPPALIIFLKDIVLENY